MKNLFVVLVISFLSGLSATISCAQEAPEKEIPVYSDPPLEKWLLSNGKEVEARLLYFTTRTNEEKNTTWDAILLASNTNKIVELRYSHFDKSVHPTLKKRQKNQRSQKRARTHSDGEQAYPAAPPLGWQYAQYDDVIRDFIPTYNQTDYGYKAGSCVPNSLVNSLAWWDQQGIVKFPQKHNREKQIDWLHTRITREAKTRNRGTSFQNLIDGVNDFTADDLKGDYDFPCTIVSHLTPEKLAFFTKGNAAVCLAVEVYFGKKHQSGHGVTVTKATPDGKISINTWGLKLDGQLKRMPKKFQSKQKGAPIKYEIEWRNKVDIPEYLLDMKLRFTIERGRFYVFYPLEKQQAGMTWRPAPQSYYLDGTTPQQRAKAMKKSVVKRTFTDPTKESGNKTFYTKPTLNQHGRLQHVVGSAYTVVNRQKYSSGYYIAEPGATIRLYKHSALPKETEQKPSRKKYRKPLFYGWNGLPDKKQRDKENKHFNVFSEEYQKGASIENSFASALIWWDNIGIINLTEYGISDRDFICDAISTQSKSNLASKNWKAMSRKVQEFAKTQLKDDFQFYYREKELNFETLHKECAKNQAVMLGVSLVIDTGYFSHGINIISATTNGDIQFQAWGSRYKGKIMTKRVNGYYHIKVTDGTLPDWFTEKKVKLVISRSGKAIKIFRPLIKVKEGMIYRKPFADIRKKK